MTTSRPSTSLQAPNSRRIAMKASRSPPRRRGSSNDGTPLQGRTKYRDIAPSSTRIAQVPEASRERSPDKSPGYSFQSCSRIDDVFACLTTPTTPPSIQHSCHNNNSNNHSTAIVDSFAQNIAAAAAAANTNPFWNSSAAAALAAQTTSLGFNHVSPAVSNMAPSTTNTTNTSNSNLFTSLAPPPPPTTNHQRLSQNAAIAAAAAQLYTTPPPAPAPAPPTVGFGAERNTNIFGTTPIEHDAFALGPSAGSAAAAAVAAAQPQMDDDFFVRAAARAADSAKLAHRMWLKEAQQEREASAQLNGVPLSAKDKERERSRRESAVTRKRAEVYIAELERAARRLPALERRIVALSAALQAAAAAAPPPLTPTSANNCGPVHPHGMAAAAAMMAFASPASGSNNSPSSTEDGRASV